MSINKIILGDRVKIIREYPPEPFDIDGTWDGHCGVVVQLRDSVDYPYRVRFDNGFETIVHAVVRVPSAKMTGKYPTIVITTDGKTTTAVKRVGKTVVSKSTSVCSDDDEFDFDVGAAVAISRLIGGKYHVEETKPKPRNYTGKVVCLESWEKWWTPGKCYEVVDGVIIDDDGARRARASGANSFEEFYDLWVGVYDNREARFAEVVERDG